MAASYFVDTIIREVTDRVIGGLSDAGAATSFHRASSGTRYVIVYSDQRPEYRIRISDHPPINSDFDVDVHPGLSRPGAISWVEAVAAACNHHDLPAPDYLGGLPDDPAIRHNPKRWREIEGLEGKLSREKRRLFRRRFDFIESALSEDYAEREKYYLNESTQLPRLDK